MKQPDLYQQSKANLLPLAPVRQLNPTTQVLNLNRGVSIYPYGQDQTFIEKGYNKNAWVYSIVSKCAKKFSQVPWYHYKIKTSERKTWGEYIVLTKSMMHDAKAVIEAKKMRTKSVDQVIVDSPLSKLLAKPNRNQSGAEFRENLYGYKLLTGEGNIYFSRLDINRPPNELFVIPKQNVAMVKGSDGLADVSMYKLLLGGQEVPVDTDSLIMWAFANYNFDPINLTHLRGQAPLDAGLLIMQASNEGAERLTSMNKNQGVAGLAFNELDTRAWTVEQAQFNRRQFNSIVNDSDLAGTIAYMNGKFGYIQFGMNAEQLKLLEQTDIQFRALCNIFDVPYQLFGNSDSYENRKQYKRDFVYDNIAVAAYGLRDELNMKLIPEFNLDRDRDVIDFAVMDLPELTEDVKDQVDALSKAWWLTPNEIRKETGFEEITDPNMDKIYVSSSIVSMEQLNADIGTNLDQQMQDLNAGL
jgi:HK97 family phage portal protein